MSTFSELKCAAMLVALLGAGLDLSACTDVREAVGTIKTPPDEFEVSTRAPLVVPPDVSLRPPRPDAGSGREADASSPASMSAQVNRDLASALGTGYSDGEKFLLTRSNALAVDPNRKIVTPTLAQAAPVPAVSPPSPATPEAPVAAAMPSAPATPAPAAAMPSAPATPATTSAATPASANATESATTAATPSVASTIVASATPTPPVRRRRTLLKSLFGDTVPAMTPPVAAVASTEEDDDTPAVISSGKRPRRTLFRLLFGSDDAAPASTEDTESPTEFATTAPDANAPPQRRTLLRLLFPPSAAPTPAQQASAPGTSVPATATEMPGERRTLFRLLFPPAEAATMPAVQTASPGANPAATPAAAGTPPAQVSTPVAAAPKPAAATATNSTPATDMPPQRRTLFRLLFPPAEAATMEQPKDTQPSASGAMPSAQH